MGMIPDPVPILPGDLLGLIKDFPNQIKEALTLGTEVIIRDPIDHIIIAGVGGSGNAGEILQSILWDDKIPVASCTGMTLPGFANAKTLVVLASYSGDADETLSVYTDATKKKCRIMAVTSGGRLARMAKQDGLATILLPRGLLPRQAYGYILFTMLAVLSRSHLCEHHLLSFESSFESLLTLLERSPYIQSAQALSKRLATATPLIYTTPRLEGVGTRWALTLNLSAKVHAFCSVLPNATHTNLASFGMGKQQYHVIILHDDRDPLPLKRRIEAFKQVVRQSGTQVTDIELKGISHLSKIVSACHLGDYVSYYLAETLGADPVSIKKLDEFKALVRKGEGQKSLTYQFLG